MTAKDTITLPREVVKFVLQHLEWWSDDEPQEKEAITALRTALAAEQPKPKPEPVGVMQESYIIEGLVIPVVTQELPVGTPLYTAPPATHPGYVIGSHWLETAYSRICAGEAEADVLRDCGWERVDEALRRDAERYEWLLNWLVCTGLLSLKTTRIDTPESYGDWFVLRKPHIIDGDSLLGYGKTEDAAIDAAMGDKT